MEILVVMHYANITPWHSDQDEFIMLLLIFECYMKFEVVTFSRKL